GEDDYDDDYDFDDDDEDMEGGAPQEHVDPWERIIRERTPLTPEDRHRRAVDAAWFYRTYDPLGRKRWAALAEPEKYGWSGAGHKNAKLLSVVLRGGVKLTALPTNDGNKTLKAAGGLEALPPPPRGEQGRAVGPAV